MIRHQVINLFLAVRQIHEDFNKPTKFKTGFLELLLFLPRQAVARRLRSVPGNTACPEFCRRPCTPSPSWCDPASKRVGRVQECGACLPGQSVDSGNSFSSSTKTIPPAQWKPFGCSPDDRGTDRNLICTGFLAAKHHIN